MPYQERGTRSHISSHISAANKVNAFLKTISRSPAQKQHCERLAAWMQTLGSQISLDLPPPPVKVAPPMQLIQSWVRGLVEGGRQVMEGSIHLSSQSALQIQGALVAQLVVGNECTTPLRLSIIKSLVHPSRVRI